VAGFLATTLCKFTVKYRGETTLKIGPVVLMRRLSGSGVFVFVVLQILLVLRPLTLALLLLCCFVLFTYSVMYVAVRSFDGQVVINLSSSSARLWARVAIN